MAIKTRIPEIYDSITSAAWITPEGEFIPLNGNIHDDYWSRFGIPEGEKYPSRTAVKMGYAKVSNPFVVSVNRIMRSDPRLERMAQFTAEAIVAFDKNKTIPSWMDNKYRNRSPLEWIFALNVNDERDEMHVKDFIGQYGSETARSLISSHFNVSMNESLIRKIIRRILAG
jgi:hypothetical protein